MNELAKIIQFKKELIAHLKDNGAISLENQIDIKNFISKYPIPEMKLMMAMHDLFRDEKQPLIFEDKHIFKLGTGRTLNSFQQINAFLRLPENKILKQRETLMEKYKVVPSKATLAELAEIENAGRDKIKLGELIIKKLKTERAFDVTSQYDLRGFLAALRLEPTELKEVLSDISRRKVIFENGDFLKLGVNFHDGKPVMTLHDLKEVKAYYASLVAIIEKANQSVSQNQPKFSDLFYQQHKPEQISIKNTKKKSRKPFYKLKFFWILLILTIVLFIYKFVDIDFGVSKNEYLDFIKVWGFPIGTTLTIMGLLFRNSLSDIGDKITRRNKPK